jgi:predicted ATPase
MRFYLLRLAIAITELGQFKDAWRCFGEAMTAVETIKERWCEAKINRAVGELALVAAKPDATKAEPISSSPSQSRANNKPNPGTPRRNEPRASLARSRQVAAAHDLLAPIYGWFTEGFNTRNLIEAKTLLEELAT